jgi:hypothetical protein
MRIQRVGVNKFFISLNNEWFGVRQKVSNFDTSKKEKDLTTPCTKNV